MSQEWQREDRFCLWQADRVDGTEESHLQFCFVHCLQTMVTSSY